MGQASEAVKSASDYVSDSNTDFGIATFLSRYFEGEFSDHGL
jgi:hydroxymethylpyrimidine pyrophosphatase-like HAD family hydrolase